MTETLACPKCGEKNEEERTYCWVCYGPFRDKKPGTFGGKMEIGSASGPTPAGFESASRQKIFSFDGFWVAVSVGVYLIFLVMDNTHFLKKAFFRFIFTPLGFMSGCLVLAPVLLTLKLTGQVKTFKALIRIILTFLIVGWSLAGMVIALILITCRGKW